MTRGSIKKTASSARALEQDAARGTACAAWLLAFAFVAMPATSIAASDTSSEITAPMSNQAGKTTENRGANTTAQDAMRAGKDGADDAKVTAHDAMKATNEGAHDTTSSGSDVMGSNTENAMNNAGSASTGGDGAQDAGAADAPTAAPMAGGSAQFITNQGADEMLVDELDDADVVTGDDTNIGEVEDVLVGSDHRIRALVVEVGGFLGMGEKKVAVDFERFEQSRNEGGKLRLKLQATVDELKAAPEFVPLEDRKG